MIAASGPPRTGAGPISRPVAGRPAVGGPKLSRTSARPPFLTGTALVPVVARFRGAAAAQQRGAVRRDALEALVLLVRARGELGVQALHLELERRELSSDSGPLPLHPGALEGRLRPHG